MQGKCRDARVFKHIFNIRVTIRLQTFRGRLASGKAAVPQPPATRQKNVRQQPIGPFENDSSPHRQKFRKILKKYLEKFANVQVKFEKVHRTFHESS